MKSVLPAVLPALALLAALAIPAAAQNPQTLACAAPFHKDASHDSIEKAFGKENVTFETVPGPEGSEVKATVIFAKDPARRLELQWQDEEKRARLFEVKVANESKWQGPNGIRIGTPLAEIEQINGAPFDITGFSWDLGGFGGAQKGKLAKLPGGCVINFRFSPEADVSSPKHKSLIGDRKIRSNNKLLREVKPVVTDFYLAYPVPQ